MFSNKKGGIQKEMQKVESEAISSIIDKNMSITGEIVFSGKTRIDGAIHGNINGEHLILSESGKISGDVNVASLSCFGCLEGNVRANIVIAQKSSSIHGRIEAGSLTVEPGAILDGEIKAATQELLGEIGKKATVQAADSQQKSEKTKK